MELISNNEEETRQLAAKLAVAIKDGGLILLNGELGTGKTFLVKHLLSNLGIPEKQGKSPTYTYIRAHQIKDQKIYHLDLYRTDSQDHLLAEEIEEMLKDKSSIMIIEWANRMPHIHNREKTMEVNIEYVGPTKRKITIHENL